MSGLIAADEGLQTHESAGPERQTGNTSGWARISLIREMDLALSRGMTGKELAERAPGGRALLRNDLNCLPLRPAQGVHQIKNPLDKTISGQEPFVDLDILFGGL